jgi:hypothetical protein
MANRSVLGIFGTADEAVLGADKLVAAGVEDFEILSDTPYPEGAFGERPSRISLYVFPLIGAAIGLSVALLLTAGTQLAYPMVTGGKPILALPPMFIISYEGTMLGAILFTILGVIFESRLPRLKVGLYDRRITEGYVGILVDVNEEHVEQIQKAFEEAQAVDVKVEGTFE